MTTRLLSLLFAGSLLAACSTPRARPAETSFLRDFSLGQAVQTMDVPQLQGRSGSSSVSGSHGAVSQFRRDFRLEFALSDKPDAPFDDAEFLNRVRMEVEKAVVAAGARIMGSSGGTVDGFDFRYETPEGHVGSVDVVGTRVAGGKYKMWGVIHESVHPGRPA